SIMGNLLLVLGLSLLAGGLKHSVQRFNRTAAGVGATLLVLGSIGFLVPALFHGLVDVRTVQSRWAVDLEHRLSAWVSLVLLAGAGLSLVFSLVTQKDVYKTCEEAEPHEQVVVRMRAALGGLVAATLLVVLMSHVLVGAVEETSHALGLSSVFVGVVLVAVVGNAAENS